MEDREQGGKEDHKFTQGQDVSQDGITPEDHDPQDPNAPQNLQEGGRECIHPSDPHGGPESLPVLPGEATLLVLLSQKGLDDPDPRESFLEDAVQLGTPLLNLQAPATDLLPELGDRKEEQREADETEEGELPVEQKEQDTKAQDVEGLPEGMAEGEDHRLPHKVYVQGEPRHEFAGGTPAEKAEGKRVNDSVQVIADIHHHVFGHVAHQELVQVGECALHDEEDQEYAAYRDHHRQLVRLLDPGQTVDHASQVILERLRQADKRRGTLGGEDQIEDRLDCADGDCAQERHQQHGDHGDAHFPFVYQGISQEATEITHRRCSCRPDPSYDASL